MKRFSEIVPLALLLGLLVPISSPLPAGAGPLSHCEPDGLQESGAIYRICMPSIFPWNGDLVIWAHGYVAFNEPVAIPEDQLCLPDGPCIPDIVNTLGFGFATTSYSTNGLAVLQGIEDVVDLVDLFAESQGEPDRVYLVGASEGGLITVLAVEQHPDLFDGGVATCGPIGDFQRQIDYFGDFRAVFDFFFPNLLPGSPTEVPEVLINNWEAYYQQVVMPIVFNPANKGKLDQLLKVAHVPFDKKDPDTIETSVSDALWYNIFATNDAVEKLGGQPFDNQGRRYRGSNNDFLLNLLIERIDADQTARDEIDVNYQTSGELISPLVTLHTTKDQQVFFAHEWLYRKKVRDAGSRALHTNISARRYGHCNFKLSEVLLSFALLVNKVTAEPLEGVEAVLTDPKDLKAFLKQEKKLKIRRRR
jgi:pimeloyl-ACP methyl ester carboxylesterase